jgi:serine/threonine protein kinase
MNAGNVIGGKYRLVRLLGEGAMGEVWAAVNELTGGSVAVKLLRHHSDELRARLFREARACGKLKHKNVIVVHDVGETAEGEPFLVMELLSGETLAEHLARTRRLRQQPAARIARDVARALAVAHEAGVIHRDLKPANIFLHREAGSDEAVVKVLDFGVSKTLDRSELTKHGVAVGSPAYMSPEQAGASRALDHRTDIWSLGVVLFQLLAGKKPFEGDALQLFVKILTEPIPVVSQFVRNVDPALVSVVSRCLERDLAARIGSAEELVAILDRFAQPAAEAPSAPDVPPLPLTPPACPATMLLPPELQTISSWSLPEPHAATSTRPAADGEDGDESAATQQYEPRMLRAMARLASEPPPAPHALPDSCIVGSGGPPDWGPPPAPPPLPAFPRDARALLPPDGAPESAWPARMRATVRMPPQTAERLMSSPTYQANTVVTLLPLPPEVPPGQAEGVSPQAETVSVEPATTPIDRRPAIAAAVAIAVAACALGLGATWVVVHDVIGPDPPRIATSAATDSAGPVAPLSSVTSTATSQDPPAPAASDTSSPDAPPEPVIPLKAPLKPAGGTKAPLKAAGGTKKPPSTIPPWVHG